MSGQSKIPHLICPGMQLPELGKFSFAIHFRGERREAFLIRFKGVVYCYLNECMHMHKRLDDERDQIFDETGRFLRCSSHGACYDPATGKSLSEIGAGKMLTAVKVKEEAGWIGLADKKAVLCG